MPLILHSADIQVKNREKSLYKPSLNNLKEIENWVKQTKCEICVLAGDLFEYPDPTESERKLIYNFIARLLNIETLKELIIIAGNHDLIKEKKQNELNIGHNALNVFADLSSNLDETKASKLIYMDKSKTWFSNVSPVINYHAYSLEDNMQTDHKFFHGENKLDICIYHAMIKEFVESHKIPLRKDILNSLDTLDIFPPNSLILAGDIHMQLNYKGEQGQDFYYPGSSQQQTHKEGNYIVFTGDCIELKAAEDKVVNLYDVTDNGEYSLKKLPLKNYVVYNTFELQQVSNVSEYLNQLKVFIEHNRIKLNGIDKTFIKVKSINSFLSNEKEIYDDLKFYFENSDIHFEYDKFVQTGNTVNNQIISEILVEKKIELDAKQKEENPDETSVTPDSNDMIITSENIDSLILSDVQIEKLFASVLENNLKAIKDEDIGNSELSTDIKALFTRELALLANSTNSKRYNIVFEDIETSGFMALKALKIMLNIPGIIRILGTNGIGKTTLYNMLRWILTGKVYPGMKDNQVVKNNLIVFNKKLPHLDIIDVKLNMTINNQKILAVRTLERKWKNNTTDEQKSSIKWKEYVSTVSQTFKIDITTASGEIKSIVGETAEKSLALWLGESVNNILFLNQSKIESILRTSSDDLNELILNFIGVDYIKKLEANLDSVKAELMTVSKPTKSKEDLLNAITDNKIFVKEELERTEDIKSRLVVLQTNVENKGTQKNEINTKLLNLGNIPNLIETCKEEIGTVTTFLDTFVAKEKKEKEIFTDIQPELDQKLIDEKIQNKANVNATMEGILERSKNTASLQEGLEILIQKEVDAKIENEKTVVEGFLKGIETHKAAITAQYALLATKFGNIVEKLGEKEKDSNDTELRLNNEITQHQTKIDENLLSITSGKCDKCGTILTKDFENHKIHLLEENEKLENLILECKKAIPQNRETLKLIQTRKKEYQDLKDNSLLENLAFFNEKILQDTTNTDIFWTINANTIKIADLNSSILICTANQEKWNKLISNIKNNVEIAEICKTELIESYIVKFNQYNLDLSRNDTNVAECNSKIIAINSEIETLKNTHIELLTSYQQRLNASIANNNAIDTFNTSVDTHNKSKDLKTLDKVRLELDCKKLETDSLPIYTELKERYDQLTEVETAINTEIKTKNEELTKSKLKHQELNNKQAPIELEYANYIKYQKNNLIWKIYSKLIKDNFKEIVFEYYRTFLNNTLNVLLEDVNFKLFWNNDSELYHVDYSNGQCTFQPVQQSSGMETCFLGLALVYTIHLLNVKNSVSHIFIDEISGTLSDAEGLSYDANNYQELFVQILNKFTNKSIFIIDHHVKQLFETMTYEVIPGKLGSEYVAIK